MKLNKEIFEPGTKVFLGTVTKYYLGVVVEVSNDSVLLTNASWVFDTGKMGDFSHNIDALQEVEVYHKNLTVQINTDMVVEAFIVSHLPVKSK
jgi:hypothetical protein